MKFDVLIVGGGPAGLSAALLLGRCRRKVLLCDEGRQRNLSSHAIHGLLGREGRSPSSFLREALEELSRYESVSVRGTRVTDVIPAGGKFEFVCADGTTGFASKILLATGLVDELPDLTGIKALYGISVHHCLYCDGYEYAGRPVAAYGKDDKGVDLAIMMKHWMEDVLPFLPQDFDDRYFQAAPQDQWVEGAFSGTHGSYWDKDGNLYVQDWNVSGRIMKLVRVK